MQPAAPRAAPPAPACTPALQVAMRWPPQTRTKRLHVVRIMHHHQIDQIEASNGCSGGTHWLASSLDLCTCTCTSLGSGHLGGAHGMYTCCIPLLPCSDVVVIHVGERSSCPMQCESTMQVAGMHPCLQSQVHVQPHEAQTLLLFRSCTHKAHSAVTCTQS